MGLYRQGLCKTIGPPVPQQDEEVGYWTHEQGTFQRMLCPGFTARFGSDARLLAP